MVALLKRSGVLCLVALIANPSAWAVAMEQLDDSALSEVSGQDGVALALKGFSLKSESHFGYTPLTLTYTMPNDADPLFKDGTKPVSYIQYSNYDISRTDPADVFADPYQIQVESVPFPTWLNPAQWLAADDPILTEPDAGSTVPGKTKLDVIRILNPKNEDGAMKWNMSYDWKVATNVRTDDPSAAVIRDMGNHIIKDMAIYGGGISLLPAWSSNNANDVKGAAFGLDINMAIGEHILRLRRTTADNSDNFSELVLSGIRLGAANSALTGVDGTKTWKMSDVYSQPGIITSEVGPDGKSVLRMGIEWYRPDNNTDAPVGAFSIDNIAIKNGPPSAPTVTNLGGVSIGGMQIRYLDVVFRNPCVGPGCL